ncbi:hypothetical protein LMG28727_07474 [Paraburkholderia kirstenboschensis]|nr:hypothetical protein LMG28727_07474 [Paraburkholderia kirstenboschensis]
MTNPANDNSVLTIESNSIEYVAPENRHGKPVDLFTLWFCTNVAPLAVISGATSVLIFHLDLVSAILAIVVGQFFGAIFHALTSAQGPLVGVPQMIQSRAQFGRYGSRLCGNPERRFDVKKICFDDYIAALRSRNQSIN